MVQSGPMRFKGLTKGLLGKVFALKERIEGHKASLLPSTGYHSVWM